MNSFKQTAFLILIIVLGCSQPSFEPSCPNHSTFTNNTCKCEDGFLGETCEVEDKCITTEMDCNGFDCELGTCLCPEYLADCTELRRELFVGKYRVIDCSIDEIGEYLSIEYVSFNQYENYFTISITSKLTSPHQILEMSNTLGDVRYYNPHDTLFPTQWTGLQIFVLSETWSIPFLTGSPLSNKNLQLKLEAQEIGLNESEKVNSMNLAGYIKTCDRTGVTRGGPQFGNYSDPYPVSLSLERL